VHVAASIRKFDSSKVQWEKCPGYKYILKMHPPFSKSLLPMTILQINNRTFVNAKNIFFVRFEVTEEVACVVIWMD
jgi:hypothetical protein